jgi:hypothetical protein
MCVPFMAFAIQVSFFIGDVTLLRSGQKTPLAVGDKLKTGDLIKTGKDSMVEIRDNGGNIIKVLAMSKATIGNTKIAGSDTVSLIVGDMSGTFKKLMKGGVKTYTPTTIAAVRGTEYTMTVSPGGDTRIDLSSGVVDVSNPYGRTAMRQNEKIETRVGQAPRSSSGLVEEWKKSSEENFKKNPGAVADDTEKYLDTLGERGKDTAISLPAVKSAVNNASNKESLEQAESLLNNTTEKTEDDAFLNDALGNSLSHIMEDFKDKDENLYSKFKSAFSKSNIVAEQHRKNIEALARIREEYQKAYKRIMGKYKTKSEEIKSKYKDKKSGM